MMNLRFRDLDMVKKELSFFLENAAQRIFCWKKTVFWQKTETETAGKTTAEKAAGCGRACFFVSVCQ